MKLLIYTAATACAVVAVLSTRLIIPALIVLFRAIEAGFAPNDAESTPVLVAVPDPIVVPEPVAPKKPRAARRRKPSKATLARAAAALA